MVKKVEMQEYVAEFVIHVTIRTYHKLTKAQIESIDINAGEVSFIDKNEKDYTFLEKETSGEGFEEDWTRCQSCEKIDK